ncbi:6508_t:CDS:2, partial [Entrophospora sp. SA101]
NIELLKQKYKFDDDNSEGKPEEQEGSTEKYTIEGQNLEMYHPSPLHTFKKHIDTVNKVSWSPHIKSLFASCSDDKSVIIWNSVNIKEDNGIHFTHNLHRSKVVDFAWHPNPDYDRTIASISSGSETTSGLLQ